MHESREIFDGGQTAKSGMSDELLNQNPDLVTRNEDKTAIEVLGENVHVRFFFGGHGTVLDSEKLREEINNCDIFVPEVPNWNESLKKCFDTVAEGSQTPDAAWLSFTNETPGAIYNSSGRRLLEILYNSRKTILFLDRSLEDALPSEQELSENGRFDKIDSFETVIEKLKTYVQVRAKYENERETLIIQNLRHELDTMRPVAENSVPLVLLVNIGAVHTGIFHQLQKEKQHDISRSFSIKPFIYAYGSEAIRRCQFGKEVSDDLAAKTLLEMLIGNYLDMKTSDTDEMVVLSREIISKFSIEEIGAVYSIYQNRESREDFNRKLEDVLARKQTTA